MGSEERSRSGKSDFSKILSLELAQSKFPISPNREQSQKHRLTEAIARPDNEMME
jgi:hypothetical protein